MFRAFQVVDAEVEQLLANPLVAVVVAVVDRVEDGYDAGPGCDQTRRFIDMMIEIEGT